MIYELAKELKDAGFTQESLLGGGKYIIPDGTEESSLGSIGAYLSGEPSDSVYAPTLSELIEACGDGIHELRIVWTPEENWGASQEGITDGDSFEMGIEIFDCPTPEEAVARLWLALHST